MAYRFDANPNAEQWRPSAVPSRRASLSSLSTVAKRPVQDWLSPDQTACRGTCPPLQCHRARPACLGLWQVVLKNMSLVRATVSIKRISAESEDEAVFAFSPKHVVRCTARRATVACSTHAHSEQARGGSNDGYGGLLVL